MTNNFEIIKPLLQFNPDEFYFVQILQRNKDGHKTNGNNRNRLVTSYYISSEEYFDRKQQEIIETSYYHHARAMIHLSPRNYQTIALQTLSLIAEQIAGGNIQHLYRSYQSVCGRNKGTDRRWIIDIDKEDMGNLSENCEHPLSHFLWYLEPMGEKVLATIPSKTGAHMITKPFNLQKFYNKYPYIEVHKNNPTNLYIP